MASIPIPPSQDSNTGVAPDLTKRNKYWWGVIGRVLSVLLVKSSYSEVTRASYDEFFRSCIAPLLGPTPEEYTSPSPISFMCDDNTPVEIGWVFKPTGEMSIQYAIEPLSTSNGSLIPTPQHLAILQRLSNAGQCQSFDLSWSRKCTHLLLYPSNSLPCNLQRTSQFFIGVDLSRAGMGLKTYFLPQVRSQTMGVPVMDILDFAISSLGIELPWSMVTPYFSTLPAGFNIEPVIAAVDCVPDVVNRFKVYIRTQATHLSALCDMLTLGGQLQGAAIDDTLAKLRDLWHALFGPISDETPVEHKRSNVGPTGFLFHYEMVLGNPFPTPKVYIPAARFLESDAHVARVVSEFVGSSYCGDVQSLL